MSKFKWFTFNEEDGYITHESEQHAKEYAQKLIDECRDCAREDGEWPDDTESTVYGQITHRVVTVRLEYEGDDRESCDYELKPVN